MQQLYYWQPSNLGAFNFDRCLGRIVPVA